MCRVQHDAPEGFWAEQARLIDWQEPPQQVLDASQPPFARWPDRRACVS